MNKSKLNKKVMLFSIILVFVMCLGCASASENIDDNSTDEVLTTPTEDVGTDDQVLTAEDTNNSLGSNEDNNVLRADTATFKDLYSLIRSTEVNTTLELDRHYVYNSASDANYISGLEINKNITVDGAGYCIDGSNLAQIFNINLI